MQKECYVEFDAGTIEPLDKTCTEVEMLVVIDELGEPSRAMKVTGSIKAVLVEAAEAYASCSVNTKSTPREIYDYIIRVSGHCGDTVRFFSSR